MLGVSRYPDSKPAQKAFVLLPGFSQNMSDLDYFMSRLAKKLVALNHFVLNIDLPGHGNSDLGSEELTWSILTDGLISALNYAQNEVEDSVILITRGLFNVLCYESEIPKYAHKMLTINHCHIKNLSYEILKNLSERKEDIVEIVDYTKKDVIWNLFVETLGGELTNMNGQRYSIGFLKEIANKMSVNFHRNNPKIRNAFYWNDKFLIQSPEQLSCMLAHEYAENSFIRNAYWQDELICQLSRLDYEGNWI
jgi:hypothetical protein